MSTHFVDKYKYSHDKRKQFLMRLVEKGDAEILRREKRGWLIKTTNGIDYRVSRKGAVTPTQTEKEQTK